MTHVQAFTRVFVGGRLISSTISEADPAVADESSVADALRYAVSTALANIHAKYPAVVPEQGKEPSHGQ